MSDTERRFIPFIEVKRGAWVPPDCIIGVQAIATRAHSIDEEGKHRYRIEPTIIVTTEGVADGDSQSYWATGDADVKLCLEGLGVVNWGLARMLRQRLDEAVAEAEEREREKGS